MIESFGNWTPVTWDKETKAAMVDHKHECGKKKRNALFPT